ncbi:hypothetical protein CASFOL_018105 [Castilleja foliolosa]|uniref:Transposase n=1 Tax=Castilleja foliolosa TaxID=1961234 RepID=A0ABD3D8T0_9LAMI
MILSIIYTKMVLRQTITHGGITEKFIFLSLVVPAVRVSEPVNREELTRNDIFNMIEDAAGPDFDMDGDRFDDETPNAAAQSFYDLLDAGKKPLYRGCEKHTLLSFVSRLMNIKAENNISQKCYNQLSELIKGVLPAGNLVPANFYESKKLLRGIGLPVEKIDCCKNNCMIFWGNELDSSLTACKICNEPRYKPIDQGNKKRRKTLVAHKKMYYIPLTPRLQRLYASPATAHDMRWHAEHVTEENVMNHPSDSEAWKLFNQTHSEFAMETRNVRLGLCTDGFQPFGSYGAQYSSWPVVVTPYNLPPWMCMKAQFMFLTVLVPGPANPKHNLDVFLQPLIRELNELWTVGAQT